MSLAGLAAKGLVAFGPNTAAVAAGVGVLNAVDGVQSILKAADALARIGSNSGSRVADEMVALMRERAPKDTGAGAAAISWDFVGDMIEVSAIGEPGVAWPGFGYSTSDTFYMVFQEFGTQFQDAQPFFRDSAREVLAAYRLEMERLIEALPAETGLD